jgi:hypothetical protein
MNHMTRARWKCASPLGGRSQERRTGKAPVVAPISAETGEIRSKVLTNVSGATLREVIAETVKHARQQSPHRRRRLVRPDR